MEIKKQNLFLTGLLFLHPKFGNIIPLFLWNNNFLMFGIFLSTILLLLIVIFVLFGTIQSLTKLSLKVEGFTSKQIAEDFYEPPATPAIIRRRIFVYGGLIAASLLVLFLFLNPFEENRGPNLAGSNSKAGLPKLDSSANKSNTTINETTVKLITDPSELALGKTVYMTYCLACHGDKGQGVVGPNLTDLYWLHGNKITDIFKTIKLGVVANGMPSWSKVLSPTKISEVSSFIKSLAGTNPAGAKAPQGIKIAD